MNWVKRVLSFILSLSMCFTLFSFYPVFAESTYIIVEEGCNRWLNYDGNFGYVKVSHDVRGVNIQNGNDIWGILISDTSFKSLLLSDDSLSGCIAWNVNNGFTSSKFSDSDYYRDSYTKYHFLDAPIFTIIDYPNMSTTEDIYHTALYYTYGEGSIDLDPEPQWGNPANVMFNTRIAGSGNASSNNIDRIVWSPDIDSNSNPLPTGARIQIRAIPGKYVSNSKTDLLTQTYNDFVIDHSKAFVLTDRVATGGVYEIKWGEVVDHFQLFPYSWVPDITFIDNEYFKMGWIYQIRLQIDDYYSDWINIYNATSAGVSVSDSITDSDTISQELIKNIEIVNNLNQTTTNWYINETTINMQEYEEPEEGDKPWWAYLLEAILGGLNITNNYFENGNGDTQLIVNTTNNYDDDLNIKLNEYNDIEDQQIQNLDDSLEAIDTDSEILSNNKFINSANWVTQQYNRMTNGTVIGSLIGFSLLFGLALIFIGKIR